MADDGQANIDHDTNHDTAACALAWQALRRAHARVAARLEAALLQRYGLALNEFDVLFELQGKRTISAVDRDEHTARVNELLEVVPLSQPAMSRLLTRLEARGLLARCPATEDKRGIIVRLTDRGADLTDDATRLYVETIHQTLTGKLSDDEQAALLGLLGRIGG